MKLRKILLALCPAVVFLAGCGNNKCDHELDYPEHEYRITTSGLEYYCPASLATCKKCNKSFEYSEEHEPVGEWTIVNENNNDKCVKLCSLCDSYFYRHELVLKNDFSNIVAGREYILDFDLYWAGGKYKLGDKFYNNDNTFSLDSINLESNSNDLLIYKTNNDGVSAYALKAMKKGNYKITSNAEARQRHESSDGCSTNVTYTSLYVGEKEINIGVTSAEKYTVTLKDETGSIIDTKQVEAGEKYVIDHNIHSNNFLGWSEGKDLFTSEVEVHEDMTIVPMFGSDQGTRGIQYTLTDEDYYSVTGYNGHDEDIIIPSIYNGKPVKEIADSAFINKNTIRSILLPFTITKIGSSAFLQMESLKFFDIEKGSLLTTIGNSAFSGCKSLVYVYFGKAVNKIGENCFFGCTDLSVLFASNEANTYNISYGEKWITDVSKTYFNVKEIGKSEKYSYFVDFNDKVTLMRYLSVTESSNFYINNEEQSNLPITRVGYKCFANSGSVGQVEFGDSVQFIDDFAFYNCSSLQKIIIGNNVYNIGKHTFSSLTYSGGINVDFTNASKLIEISDYGFYNSTVRAVFDGCSALERIGDYAFTKFSSYIINFKNTKLTSIGASAFENSLNLHSVLMPTEISYIGENCFKNCPVLKIYYMDSVYNKNAYYPSGAKVFTFAGAENLVYSNGVYYFELPNGNIAITEITNVADQNSLLDQSTNPYVMTIDKIDGKKVESILPYAFDNYLQEHSYILKLGNSVERIGDYAFYNNAGLVGVEMLDPSKSNLGYIGKNAFQSCHALKSVSIGSRLKEIQSYAFADCYNLESVDLNNNTLNFSLGSNAFNGCKALCEIFLPETLTAIGSDCFKNVTVSKCKLFFEALDNSLIDLGNSVSSLYTYYNIKNFFECGGVKYAKTYSKNISYLVKPISTVTELDLRNVNDGTGSCPVRLITAYAFDGNTSISKVILNKELETIEYSAFNSSNLSSLSTYYCESLETIGGYAFNKTKLTYIVIPSTVKVINSCALYITANSYDIYLSVSDTSNFKTLGSNYYNSSKGKLHYLGSWEYNESQIPVTK